MSYFSPAHNRKKNLRPPDLYEYYVDNFWFNSLYRQPQNSLYRAGWSARVFWTRSKMDDGKVGLFPHPLIGLFLN